MRDTQSKMLLWVLAGCLCASGCATTHRMYTGPPKRRSEIAVLRVAKPVFVRQLNGEVYRDTMSITAAAGAYGEFELPPGEHDITFVYHKFWGNIRGAPIIVKLKLEAGHTYEARYRRGSAAVIMFSGTTADWEVYVEDVTHSRE